MANSVFPNYLQMRQPLPLRGWQALRVASVTLALALCVLLVLWPDAGLTLWWGFVLPVLPLVFFVAPGLWRNTCPIAALNQAPRVLGFTRGLTLPAWLREYGFVIGFALFFTIVPARKVVFNDNGPALASLMLAVLGAAFLGGLLFKGKSGWCSSGICPLFAVQRLYGQTPFATVPNSHCRPCVGCAKNCYDFNPAVAYLADMHDEDQHYKGYRAVFAGAFPGLVLAFFTLPDPPAIGVADLYLRFALFMLAGVALFTLLDTFAGVSSSLLAALFAAVALNLYYWYTYPLLAGHIDASFGVAVPDAAVWAARLAVLGLTLLWLARGMRKERLYLAQSVAGQQPHVSLAGSVALRRARGLGQPEVTFMPEQRRVVVESGRSLLEIAERNDLRLESGCRMGVCGADPVAILAGMDNLAAVGDEERNTLERLGLAQNTRLACVARVQGDVTLSLKPERPTAFSSSVIRGFRRDPSVNRVVIIGNGIAGVTAADHLRRRHPLCEIHVVAREKHHLYNRMAIERLIYGRSAMQGLYLQDESWYADLDITTWLNTRATAIDRQGRQVTLGTGESLPFDRLILATGSSSVVPPITGFGRAGTFVMREADDALAIRAYAQEHGCRSAVVAGGGLLGLEAAYALHRLGLHVTVLERSPSLLRRQLDERGGQFLREYLEGVGLQILVQAETAAVAGNGRVQGVTLTDGRTVPCDLFLVCAGITPNVELARDAGLKVGRGVVVDDAMRTSDAAIYAAGDVAEHRDRIYGLWPTAAEQAQVAAANALGGDSRYEGSVPVTMLKVVGVDLTSVGRIEAGAAADTVIAIEDAAAHRYRKLVIADGAIAGAILFGEPLLAPIVTAAIKRNADVTPCIEPLRAGRWEVLADLPERARVGTPAAAASAGARAAVVERPPSQMSRTLETQKPTAGPRLRLTADAGPASGTTFEVGEAGATLGRTPENLVYILDQGLSRVHARFEYRDGGYWLLDMASTNGTFVNQQRVDSPRRLSNGDVIRVGRSRLLVGLNDER